VCFCSLGVDVKAVMKYARFEVFTTVKIHIVVFWVVDTF
jgi:hypothetical protein